MARSVDGSPALDAFAGLEDEASARPRPQAPPQECSESGSVQAPLVRWLVVL